MDSYVPEIAGLASRSLSGVIPPGERSSYADGLRFRGFDGIGRSGTVFASECPRGAALKSFARRASIERGRPHRAACGGEEAPVNVNHPST